MAKVPVIRIIAKRDGRRRCGIRHSEAPKFYPPGFFDKGQMAQLKADTSLVVDEMEVEQDELTPENVGIPMDEDEAKAFAERGRDKAAGRGKATGGGKSA